jgi:hypothetical protein
MDGTLALWEFALWGAFGGVAVEAVELLGATRRVGDLPWRVPGEVTARVMVLCTIVRLGLGAGLAVALGQAAQISGGVGAVAAGVAAPLILEQMSKQLPSPATGPSLPTAPAPQAPLPPPRPAPPVTWPQIGSPPRPPLPPAGSAPSGMPGYGSAGAAGSDYGPSRRPSGPGLSRQLLAGFARSTPAFGGTARVDS